MEVGPCRSLIDNVISQFRTYYRYKKKAELIVFVVARIRRRHCRHSMSLGNKAIICTDVCGNIHEMRRKRYQKSGIDVR